MRILMTLLLTLVAGLAQAAPREIGGDELLQRRAAGDDVLLVDVRTPAEFAAGHLPGAVNLPLQTLTGSEPALNGRHQKSVVIYCRSGRRTLLAVDLLEKAGFSRLEHLTGDLQGWEAAGRPLEK